MASRALGFKTKIQGKLNADAARETMHETERTWYEFSSLVDERHARFCRPAAVLKVQLHSATPV